MPMSKSSTTMRMMISIMSASLLASVTETVSARDADVAAGAKKPRRNRG
jgi:hypothetical protein